MSDAPETAHLEDALEVLRELLDRLPCECGVRRPPWGGTEFHVCRRCHDWKVVSERVRALAAERDDLRAQQESQEPDGYVVEFLDIDGRVSNRLLANTWLAAKYATENVRYNTDLTRIRPFRYLNGDET